MPTGRSTPILLLACACFVFEVPLHGERVKEQWSIRRYDGANFSTTLAVAVDQRGDVIVAGFGEGSGNIYHFTAKYSGAHGDLLWERRFQGLVNNNGDYFNFRTSAALDPHGHVIVDATTSLSSFTAKYASDDGSVLWRRQGGGGTSSVVADASGDVLVAPRVIDVGRNRGLRAQKYAAADGRLLWQADRSSSYLDHVALDRWGDVFITGTDAFNNSVNFCTAKFAGESGRTIWQNVRGLGTQRNSRESDPTSRGRVGPEGFDRGTSIAVDQKGNIAATGYLEAYTGNEDDGFSYSAEYYTAKYAGRTGRLLWDRKYAGLYLGSESFADEVQTDSAGNVVVAGTTPRGRAKDYRRDNYIVAYAANDGAILWEKLLRGFGDSAPASVSIDRDDNVWIGCTSERASGVPTFLTLKVGPDGDILWQRRFAAPGSWFNSVRKVVAFSGGAVVAGVTKTRSHIEDCVIVKYVDGASVGTLAASEVGGHSATLRGTVNPNGFFTRASFEYGSDSELADAVMSTPVEVGDDEDEIPVAAVQTSLEPHKTYYFRAVGTANGARHRGETRSFTTLRQ